MNAKKAENIISKNFFSIYEGFYSMNYFVKPYLQSFVKLKLNSKSSAEKELSKLLYLMKKGVLRILYKWHFKWSVRI